MSGSKRTIALPIVTSADGAKCHVSCPHLYQGRGNFCMHWWDPITGPAEIDGWQRTPACVLAEKSALRLAMKGAVPREDWLASPNNDTYAAAIMCCRHGDPSRCSSEQRCHMDGVCFPGGTLRYERRDLRFQLGELIRLGRELRKRLRDLEGDRRLRIVPRSCSHCGRSVEP